MYNTLRDIQGKLVLRLVAHVHLSLSLPNASIGRTDAAELVDEKQEQSDVDNKAEVIVQDQPQLLHIKGILLQYINGFSLSKVQDHAPKSEWQGIVDQAIAIVQAVGDHGILNRDVQPDNFIVQRDEGSCYWVFMIDFGLAQLQGRDKSDRN